MSELNTHGAKTEEVSVTLYSKADCPLCDQVQDDLNWLRQEVPLRLKISDIEANAEQYERFRYLVPVVEINDVLYYPPHDLLNLRRALIDATQART